MCLVRPKGQTSVSQRTLVQDYAEQGARLLDVETFTRSLHIAKMRRACELMVGSTMNLAWWFVGKAYGHLRQRGGGYCSPHVTSWHVTSVCRGSGGLS